jgi:hypothetical protein
MKTFATILSLAAGIFVNSSAQTTDSLRASPGSLEIVLNLQQAFVFGTNSGIYDVVTFSAATNITITNSVFYDVVTFSSATNITMQVTFRNVGEVNMDCPDLLSGLTVIWDGKEYKGTQRPHLGFSGVAKFDPRNAWRVGLPLSHYDIPPEGLGSGRHTVAVKVEGAESNILTIFIDTNK